MTSHQLLLDLLLIETGLLGNYQIDSPEFFVSYEFRHLIKLSRASTFLVSEGCQHITIDTPHIVVQSIGAQSNNLDFLGRSEGREGND